MEVKTPKTVPAFKELRVQQRCPDAHPNKNKTGQCVMRAGAPRGGALTSRGFFRDLGASAPGTGGERALQGQPTRGLQPGGRSRCMAHGLGGHQGS